MKNRFSRSVANLFKISAEMVDRALDYVPCDALALLTFVNQDCLQIARSRLSTSISLDYDPPSRLLIEKLILKGHRCIWDDPNLPQLCLGTRVGHIIFAADQVRSSSIGGLILGRDIPSTYSMQHVWREQERLEDRPY